jgi:hypothetical protein
VKALRTLRRKDDSGFLGLYGARQDLRRGTGQDWYPAIPVRYAVISDVTGDPYNGFLETEEAEALFIQLMENLGPARRPILGDKQFLLTFNGPRTMPLNSSGVIRKPSRRRPDRYSAQTGAETEGSRWTSRRWRCCTQDHRPWPRRLTRPHC